VRADGSGGAVGLREAVPDEILASRREMRVFGVGEVARHRFSTGEMAVPALEGHLVNLQLDGSPRVVTRCGGDFWKGVQVRGDIEIFPTGQHIRQAISGEAEAVNFLLREEALREAVERSGVDPNRFEVLHRPNVRDEQLQRLVLSFLPELETGGLGGELYAEGLANAVAVHLLRHHSSLGERASRRISGEPKPGGLSKRALKRATDYIGDNLSGGLSLVDLAAAAGYSPHHFSRLFKETTGLSPHQYVIRQRVERAKDLLLRGHPVGEVARRVGFSDQSHLSRHFRRLHGVTPAAFARRAPVG
jgi:AraC family transcriptional regulator